MVYYFVMIRDPLFRESRQTTMKSSNTTYQLTVSKHYIAAILLLVIALTNSHVPAVQAATPDRMNDVIAQAFTQKILTINSVQSDSPEETEEEPTVQEVLLNVCELRGYSESCAKTLLGMLWNESSNRSTVIGDSGKARGYFQIHYKLHKISVACAEDLVCSANWSLTYLESNGYPRYVNYAVQCHNSCGVNNGYAAKAARHSKLLWDRPLKVTQETPIEIAMK